MPPDAASDEIDATFRNGVLNITIPKRQPAVNGGRRVAVRAEVSPIGAHGLTP